jgi:hypothetical protein
MKACIRVQVEEDLRCNLDATLGEQWRSNPYSPLRRATRPRDRDLPFISIPVTHKFVDLPTV